MTSFTIRAELKKKCDHGDEDHQVNAVVESSGHLIAEQGVSPCEFCALAATIAHEAERAVAYLINAQPWESDEEKAAIVEEIERIKLTMAARPPSVTAEMSPRAVGDESPSPRTPSRS